MTESKTIDGRTEALLKASGLKRTPVRLGVLRVLVAADESMDVQDILKQLPSFTEPVTVYRTLNTLVTKKMVHRVRGEDRSWRYAVGDRTEATGEHQHAHFVCDHCGKVECIAHSKVPAKVFDKMIPGPGYKVEYPEVVLHGTCPKCA